MARRLEAPRLERSVEAVALGVSVCLAVAGCTLRTSDAPPLTGPSELGTSITLFATPDVIPQDGSSQAQVVIQVRDANSQPIRDLTLRAEITVDATIVDFGRLSSRTLVTGADGRASLMYTAPAPSPEPVDTFTVVTIRITPTGTNFANAVARAVSIRLTPPGVLLPPNGTPMPRFTYSPRDVTQGIPVQFDASTSSDDGAIVLFAWDFGDGAGGIGPGPAHRFIRSGTYQVTLTVADDRGLRASTTQLIVVSATSAPVAAFSFSPTSPAPGDTVFFNAAASAAAEGHQITVYSWTFGDGGTGTGAITSHKYTALGTFAVTLTVTDDLGKTGTTSQRIIAGAGPRPLALFVFSPNNPLVSQPVNFDGGLSTAPAGRSITRWEWNFGDGRSAGGAHVQHAYNTAADYVVVLTVTDNTGATDTSSQTVKVGMGQSPTASFTVSPSPATSGTQVNLDASASAAQGGATIVQYRWNFGDGFTHVTSERSATHAYFVLTETTFTITLTVTDSGGQQATTSNNLIVCSLAGCTVTLIR